MVAPTPGNGKSDGLRAGRREADPIVQDVLHDFARAPIEWSRGAAVPQADVRESAEAVVVALDLPGHRLEDIDVSLERDVLSVRSVRKPGYGDGEIHHRSELPHGEFARSFVLPAKVDPDGVEARYEAGVLTITMPKRAEERPRSIKVKASS